jgi:hypothetical protein
MLHWNESHAREKHPSLVVLYWRLVIGRKVYSKQQRKYFNLRNNHNGHLNDLDYPSVSIGNIFSNGQFYYRCHLSFAATLYLSLPLSLSLRYLALSPQFSINYLTLSSPTIMIIE